MDRRPRSLTVLDLLPPMDGELEAAEWDISVPLSSDSTCRAGWSWLTVSSRCPRCLQAGARWVSLGAGRPPSRSTLPRRSTSPRAETSTPHPAGTRVEPKPRRGVPRRRCIPSHSAWKGRGPWQRRPPQERYGYFFHTRPCKLWFRYAPFPQETDQWKTEDYRGSPLLWIERNRWNKPRSMQ